MSPGPGRARVLRALAYCQLRRGLYRDALETSETVLRWDGASSSRPTADENDAGESDAVTKFAVDAAMLMSRADALVSEETGCVGTSRLLTVSTMTPRNG